ncbi:hypothetical protein GGS24DRAFT_501882 [Hypoxylon argillaceum]|nr:hypothetical protein GGS24DRAFT_501882 [Hypoxylon argillaceum]KAI1153372.1 hypothetical protein F4825DRAFT_266585 [Nemania diffusa]
MSGEHTGSSASPQTSPRTPGECSPYQTSLRGGGDRQAENRALKSVGITQSNGETTQQSLPLRSLGVHTILNPAETQPLIRERTEEAASSPRTSSAVSNSSPHVPSPYGFPGPGTRHGRTPPNIDDQPSKAPPSIDRGSPSTARPYPPITAARRALTPRLTSPGQPHAFRVLNPPHPQPQHLPPGSQDSNRAIPSEAGIHGRQEPAVSARGSPLVQQLSRVMSPEGRRLSNITPLPTTKMPISPPVPSHPAPNLQSRAYFPGSSGVQPGQSSGYPPHNPYAATAMPQSHGGYPGPGGDPRWSGGSEHVMQYSSGGVRSFSFGEGQAALRIQPAHGEAFIVPVDTHQGSRQADEKRQRNAGASQRFRKRKKDRETQERMEHQRMESQYREMEARIHALETDRERIRSDRDRLRDIVYRTPSVSDLAYQGPPSPAPSTGSGPSPRMSRPTYGTADPETGERSSQRRRTDPHPQVEFMTTTPYGSAPDSLPPLSASGYPASVSHPGTPSARSQAPQLPPLRLGSAGGTPTATISTASTPVQSYQQLKRESYETGWATGSRASTDPSQR